MAANLVHSEVVEIILAVMAWDHLVWHIDGTVSLLRRELRWVLLVTLFGGWLALEVVLLQSSYVSNSYFLDGICIRTTG